AGCLHVEEQRRGAGTTLRLTFALLGRLARFFAVLAAHREGQRAQTLLGDLFAALVAEAVVAALETNQGIVDLVQRFGLHLDERELDVFLDVRFGAFDRIEHFVELAAPRALFADAAHLALDFRLQLSPTVLEHLLQFRIASPGDSLLSRLLVVRHVRAPSVRRSPRRLRLPPSYANELPILIRTTVILQRERTSVPDITHGSRRSVRSLWTSRVPTQNHDRKQLLNRYLGPCLLTA